MNRSFHSNFLPSKNPAIIAREAVDEIVLLNWDFPNKPLLLNTSAARIWALIDGEHTVAQISLIIAAEFETDPNNIEADVIDLLYYLSTVNALSNT